MEPDSFHTTKFKQEVEALKNRVTSYLETEYMEINAARISEDYPFSAHFIVMSSSTREIASVRRAIQSGFEDDARLECITPIEFACYFSTLRAQLRFLEKFYFAFYPPVLIIPFINGAEVLYRKLFDPTSIPSGEGEDVNFYDLSYFAKMNLAPMTVKSLKEEIAIKQDIAVSTAKKLMCHSYNEKNQYYADWLRGEDRTARNFCIVDKIRYKKRCSLPSICVTIGVNVDTLTWDVGAKSIFNEKLNCIVPLKSIPSCSEVMGNIAKVLKLVMINVRTFLNIYLVLLMNENEDDTVSIIISEENNPNSKYADLEQIPEIERKIMQLLRPRVKKLKLRCVDVEFHATKRRLWELSGDFKKKTVPDTRDTLEGAILELAELDANSVAVCLGNVKTYRECFFQRFATHCDVVVTINGIYYPKKETLSPENDDSAIDENESSSNVRNASRRRIRNSNWQGTDYLDFVVENFADKDVVAIWYHEEFEETRKHFEILKRFDSLRKVVVIKTLMDKFQEGVFSEFDRQDEGFAFLPCRLIPIDNNPGFPNIASVTLLEKFHFGPRTRTRPAPARRPTLTIKPKLRPAQRKVPKAVREVSPPRCVTATIPTAPVLKLHPKRVRPDWPDMRETEGQPQPTDILGCERSIPWYEPDLTNRKANKVRIVESRLRNQRLRKELMRSERQSSLPDGALKWEPGVKWETRHSIDDDDEMLDYVKVEPGYYRY